MSSNFAVMSDLSLHVISSTGSFSRAGAKVSVEHEAIMEAYAAIARMHSMLALHAATHLGVLGIFLLQGASSGLFGTTDAAIIMSYMIIDSIDILSRITYAYKGKRPTSKVSQLHVSVSLAEGRSGIDNKK